MLFNLALFGGNLSNQDTFVSGFVEESIPSSLRVTSPAITTRHVIHLQTLAC